MGEIKNKTIYERNGQKARQIRRDRIRKDREIKSKTKDKRKESTKTKDVPETISFPSRERGTDGIQERNR